nr:hypothetical protein [Tanacetum cinerariifolium]
HAQPEDSNELFQKLLEDLKELAEYINSLSRDRPIFFNDNEKHSVQNKEYLENPSNEIASSNSNQEKEGPPQDSDIHQLIREECSIEEVKNVVEQPTAERRTRIFESLHNFRVIHKSSISLKNTSQISPVHAIAPILSTKEPEYSPSMGYEHLSTTPETELDEVIESSAKNLLPIPSECKVTSEDESKCDMPIQDKSSSIFMTFSNPLFKDNDDLTSSDDESLSEEDVPIEESKVYSNSLFDDDERNSDELESHVESNSVESLSNHDALIDSSQRIDNLDEFSGPLIPIAEEERIRREHVEYISRIEMLFTINPRPRPTVNANIIVESIPSSLISVQDNESQREEIDIVTNTDELLSPSVKNDDDSEGEVDIVEALRVDNSIFISKHELSDNEASDNPSFPRPPPEPPDADFDFKPDAGEEISVVMNDNDELEYLDPRGFTPH